MKKYLLIFTLVPLAACHRSKDFSKIKKGMKPDEVVQLVGTPERRQPMNTAEWWLYHDPEKHVVIINNDTVTNCTTQEEAIKVMERNLKTFDSLQKTK
ncbi:MAG TPA: hypothetical protein VK543_05085 [Puia sp.]|nr:hypothetical protein [Puia sp.]